MESPGQLYDPDRRSSGSKLFSFVQNEQISQFQQFITCVLISASTKHRVGFVTDRLLKLHSFLVAFSKFLSKVYREPELLGIV